MNNISPLIKLPKNLILPLVHLDNGLKLVRLDTYDLTLVKQEKVKESTILKMSKESLVKKKLTKKILKESVMQESVPITKKKILKDKSMSLNNIIPIQKSTKTSEVVSIGNDMTLIPFWKNATQEMSRKLWSPIETDCVALELNSWNGSSKKLMLNSWFSTQILTSKTSLENYQKTYLLSLQSLLPKIMASEQLTIVEKEKSKQNLKPQKAHEKNIISGIHKINLQLDANQRQTLNKWFGCQRFIYNKCLNHIKTTGESSLKILRAKCINNINYQEENKWMLDYHYDLRDEALRDLLKNIKSNKEKGGRFEIHFKSKKDLKKKNTSISVLKKHWNKKNNFYKNIFKPEMLKTTEEIPNQLEYDTRLVKTSIDKYYIIIQKSVDLSENQTHESMVFIDPGLKTNLTCYDPSGRIITFGNEKQVSRIATLLHFKRKLQSKIVKSKSKSKLRKAMFRMQFKIDSLINDLHNKAAKWLVENYKNIFIPKLNFHTMKKLNKKSKSLLASFKHCAFVDKLIQKAKGISNVCIVNEAYTSKTCSKCGCQKQDLKNNNTYKCNDCGIIIGRDINASKNIMLRYLTLRAFKSPLVA